MTLQDEIPVGLGMGYWLRRNGTRTPYTHNSSPLTQSLLPRPPPRLPPTCRYPLHFLLAACLGLVVNVLGVVIIKLSSATTLKVRVGGRVGSAGGPGGWAGVPRRAPGIGRRRGQCEGVGGCAVAWESGGTMAFA